MGLGLSFWGKARRVQGGATGIQRVQGLGFGVPGLGFLCEESKARKWKKDGNSVYMAFLEVDKDSGVLGVGLRFGI